MFCGPMITVSVQKDSCLEFFFMLPGSDSYFNFEMNPNGVLNIENVPLSYCLRQFRL